MTFVLCGDFKGDSQAEASLIFSKGIANGASQNPDYHMGAQNSGTPISSVLLSDVPCDIPSHFGTTQEAGMSYKVAPQFS